MTENPQIPRASLARGAGAGTGGAQRLARACIGIFVIHKVTHKKERPGDLTRPNLHKTPTRLRLLSHNRGGILCAILANYQHFRLDSDEKKCRQRRNSLDL
jgi:hypothetical protein